MFGRANTYKSWHVGFVAGQVTVTRHSQALPG